MATIWAPLGLVSRERDRAVKEGERLTTIGKGGAHERQTINDPARMPVANELLHLLRRDSRRGSPLQASLEPAFGARRRVGMCLAWLPAPIVGKERYLWISPHGSQGRHPMSKSGCRIVDC